MWGLNTVSGGLDPHESKIFSFIICLNRFFCTRRGQKYQSFVSLLVELLSYPFHNYDFFGIERVLILSHKLFHVIILKLPSCLIGCSASLSSDNCIWNFTTVVIKKWPAYIRREMLYWKIGSNNDVQLTPPFKITIFLF